jgi:hypothetical protein
MEQFRAKGYVLGRPFYLSQPGFEIFEGKIVTGRTLFRS